MRDLYEVLEVSKTATDDEIKKSYRRLARKFHPDLNPGNKQAEERFKEVSIANDVLSNTEKRKLYDEFGLESIRPGFDAQRARILRSGFGGGTSGAGGAGGVRWNTQGDFNVNDIFEQIFRQGSPFGTRRPPRPPVQQQAQAAEEPRGQNLEQTIAIQLEDVLQGREMQYRMTRPDGEVVNLKVKIPAGVATGDRIRLAGQGMPGTMPRLNGDLILRVEISPHPMYRVQEKDIILDLPVTLPELVFGAQVEVPTLDGKLRVRIPIGSQSGKKLRISGKGLRDRKSETRGDFYVVLQLVAPEPTDAKAQAKLEELARAMAPLYGDVRSAILSQSKAS